MNSEIYPNYSCYLVINIPLNRLRERFPVQSTTILGNSSADSKWRVFTVAFGLVPGVSVKWGHSHCWVFLLCHQLTSAIGYVSNITAKAIKTCFLINLLKVSEVCQPPTQTFKLFINNMWKIKWVAIPNDAIIGATGFKSRKYESLLIKNPNLKSLI